MPFALVAGVLRASVFPHHVAMPSTAISPTGPLATALSLPRLATVLAVIFDLVFL